MYIILKLWYPKQANIFENIDYILVFKFDDIRVFTYLQILNLTKAL